MKARIILVDDEQNVVRWLSYALKAQDYEVETAEKGAEGLAKILADPPDLVILDVMMPDMTGTEVCEHIRDNPETADMPILMLSGKAQVGDKVKGLNSGADDYLTKPFETDEVMARIEGLVKRGKRTRKAKFVKHGKVLGFIGAKGGVGTTSIALNVALALVQRQKKVIAAELRSYFGTAALQLGILATRNLSDLLDLEPQNIDDRQLSRRLVTHSSGLQVLFGPQSIDTCKNISPAHAEIIAVGLSGMADYAILDLPGSPSPENQAIVQQCDSLIVVVNAEPTCITAGKFMVNLLRSWGVSKEKICATVIRGGESTSLALSEISEQLGCEVSGIVTQARDLSLEALNQAEPLVLSHPDSMVVGTLTELATRLATDKAMAHTA